jgi:hypothetical protein
MIHTNSYDAENRLIATEGYSYIYDGDGERVEKCTGGRDAGKPVPAERPRQRPPE